MRLLLCGLVLAATAGAASADIRIPTTKSTKKGPGSASPPGPVTGALVAVPACLAVVGAGLWLARRGRGPVAA